MVVGEVIRIPVEDTNPPKVKYLIIIGVNPECIGTIFINSDYRPQNFNSPILQNLHFPLSLDTCPFLSHDSFADCSEIRVRPKDSINQILQRDPHRKVGTIPGAQLVNLISIITRARTISPQLKRLFNLL